MYKDILISLDFQEINDYFVLDSKNHDIYRQVMIMYTNHKIIDKVLDRLTENTKHFKIEVRIDEILNKLSINFIYDSGNSEYTMDLKNFNGIFLNVLRDNKLNQLLPNSKANTT